MSTASQLAWKSTKPYPAGLQAGSASCAGRPSGVVT
jgi:hypothetical protein